MKKVLIVSLALLVVGCASAVQTGSISQAYANYEGKNYEETLESIRLAENISKITPELKAELTYLKAQTYEEMGRYETAETLYEYLKNQHRDSQYGYLAAKRLKKTYGSVNCDFATRLQNAIRSNALLMKQLTRNRQSGRVSF